MKAFYRKISEFMDQDLMRARQTTLLSIVFVTLCVGTSVAQDPLDEMYGQAVHAYFRNDTAKAEEILNEVIGAGSTDPRAYYFRGLCQVRTSGSFLAGSTDFEHGANLEWKNEGKKVVNVGKALERIQGPARTEIERVRAKARLEGRSRILEMNRARYEESKHSGPGLIVPPSAGGAANAPAAKDPFEAETGLTRGDATPMPKQPAKDATPTEGDNPFGSEPAPAGDDAPAGGDDDIFK